MNPSQFPQVIRSRSRSPSPLSRRRGYSDIGSPISKRSETEPVGDGGNLLSVPQIGVNDQNRVRSFSDFNGRPQHRRPRRGVVSGSGSDELENMANVEIVNAIHSINDCRAHPHESSSDEDHDQEGNNPDPDGVYTSRPHSNTDNGGTLESGLPPGRPAGIMRRRTMDNGSLGSGSSITPDQVDQLRRRVKFFFMDPYSKFKARRHVPWKMCLQFIKIVIITVQLVQFGGQRSDMVEYFQKNQKSLQHLLLKGWDPSFETMPYPPATGQYALYSADELLDHIDFAWEGYYNLTERSLSTITYHRDNGTVRPVTLCNRFSNYNDFHNGSYVVGPGVLHNCTDLIRQNDTEKFDIRSYLIRENITIPFPSLLALNLIMTYNSFHLNLVDTHYGPTCYTVKVTIKFKNYERSGQVLISLVNENTERECTGKIMTPAAKDEEVSAKRRSIGLDCLVIVICSLSTLLCLRSMVRAWTLKRKVEKMFKLRFGKQLQFSDRMEFVNLWYVLIFANDVFTIVGAAYKIQLEARTVTITSNTYDLCSLLLGLGGLMAWIGCLRYLNFFKKYNILILTLKTAFPSILRFMVCALSIYFGFMFCGWVILGPYHIKFRHLHTTSECLYSLVNGDDMFVTFSATVTDNLVVWYFARVYLYVFISLFIYCVLSLFISVIMDTYETLKEYHDKGYPKTELQQFVEQCNDPIGSGLYRRQHTENEGADFSLIECLAACCMKKKPPNEATERTHLLTRTI